MVRAHAVVGVFPMAESMIEPRWLVGVGVHLVELFMMAVRLADVPAVSEARAGSFATARQSAADRIAASALPLALRSLSIVIGRTKL